MARVSTRQTIHDEATRFGWTPSNEVHEHTTQQTYSKPGFHSIYVGFSTSGALIRAFLTVIDGKPGRTFFGGNRLAQVLEYLADPDLLPPEPDLATITPETNYLLTARKADSLRSALHDTEDAMLHLATGAVATLHLWIPVDCPLRVHADARWTVTNTYSHFVEVSHLCAIQTPHSRRSVPTGFVFADHSQPVPDHLTAFLAAERRTPGSDPASMRTHYDQRTDTD